MSRKNYRILQIDDQPEFHKQMRYVFGDRFDFEGVVNETKLEEKIKNNPEFDIVLLDLVLDDSNEFKGLDLIPKLRKNWPDIPIIVITQDKKKSTVVAAMKAGANNFLDKADFDLEYWEQVFLEAIEQKEEKKELKIQLKKEKEKNEYKNPIESPIIGISEGIEWVRKRLKSLANQKDAVVLITGETGVGKGVAARFFHYNSIERKEQPFQEILISNIPSELVNSELFGTKKGSFTGSIDTNIGLLQSANGGVVFLDEIGDLDYPNQGRLLQFLQSKTIRPVGKRKDIKLDVQIITATNKNLRQEIREKRFREDLFQRLKKYVIEIPPLRERREDIKPLIAHFLHIKESDIGEYFEKNVLEFICHECYWKGNVRELENTLESMVSEKNDRNLERINFDCVPKDILEPIEDDDESDTNSNIYSFSPKKLEFFPSSLDEEIAYKKLKAIEDALILKNGVKGDVAALLNYKSDDNLRYGIEKLLKGYPHLAKYFPAIQENYHRMIKKLGI